MNGNFACFYVPGSLSIVDTTYMRDGQTYGTYSHETLDQIKARYPGAILTDYETASPMIDATEKANFKHPPVEITEERFFEMLEVLPPQDWQRTKEGESFKLMERTSGVYTAIFACVAGKYYELSDSIFTTHQDILAACGKAQS